MSSAQGIRAGRAFVEIGADDKRLLTGLRNAQARLKAFGAALQGLGLRMMAIGTSLLAPLMASVKVFAAGGDALEKMSRRTGVSTEALSELGYAAELSGADLETLEVGIRKMQKTLKEAQDGSKSAGEALAALGLRAADFAGLSPEKQFELLADRISRIADPTVRAGVALELFGRSGTRLLPLMEGGAKGIEELRKQARALGLTVATQTAKDAAALTDALHTLWRVLKKGVSTIGSALAPAVTDLAETFTRAMVAANAWIKEHRQLVIWAAKIALALIAAGAAFYVAGKAITTTLGIFAALKAAVIGVGGFLSAMGSIMVGLLSPVGLLIAGVAALGVYLVSTADVGGEALTWLGDQFRTLHDAVMKVMSGIVDALKAGDIALAAQILWLALKLAWQEGAAALNQTWLEVKGFFLKTAYQMWAGAVASAEDVFHGLEVAWIETTAFLSKTWTSFTAGFQKAWNTAVNWTTKRLLELWGLFDETLDVDAAKQMADQDLADTNAEIDRQRDAALSGREQERQQQRDQSQQVHEGALAEIGRELVEAEKALQDDSSAKAEETRARLAEARRQLEEALARAKEEREAADRGSAPRRREFGDPLADLEDRLTNVGRTVEQKINVTGTFNPAAAFGLGHFTAIERTAKASEETARHTKRIEEATRQGARFA